MNKNHREKSIKPLNKEKTDLENDEQKSESIDYQLLNSINLLRKKDFEKALLDVNAILDKYSPQLNLSQKFGARLTRLLALLSLKMHENINEEIKFIEQILNQMSTDERENPFVKEGEGRFMSVRGAIHTFQGNFESAEKTYLQSLAIYEDLSNNKGMFYQLDALGWIKRVQGELDQALNFFRQQLKIAEEMNDSRRIAWAKFSSAFTLFYKGDLELATEEVHKCLTRYKELNDNTGLSWAFALLGSIYRGKGEFNKSLDYYQKVLAYYDDIQNKNQQVPHCYCYALSRIGQIYYHKNRIEDSIENFKKAKKAHNSICSMKNTLLDYDVIIMNILIILSSIEIGDNKLIEKTMEELTEFVERWPWTELFWKFSRGYILKNKPRGKYKFQAQQIFEEILEEHFDYEIEFMIQVNLCELLLEELKYSGAEDIILDIQGLLDKISNIANKQRSITTLVTLYYLQSKLALIEGNADFSKELLDKALTIAEDKGLALISKKIKIQQNQLISQLEEWKAFFIRNSTLQERVELLNLHEYISNAINDVLEEKFKTIKNFELIYKDLLKDHARIQKGIFRVGIAQMGVSETGDIINEFYEEKTPGLLNIKSEKVEIIRKKVKNIIKSASLKEVNVLLFPELIIDLNYSLLLEEILDFAREFEMYIIPGSYHDQTTNQNLSVVIGPQGVLWEQEKHIPATIHIAGKKIIEGIKVDTLPRKTIICNTEYGRIAILICRDFLNLDFRAELKNFEPPVDLILNPAFTPVTADFQAAHFDARRSIYAYCLFANVAEFGDSFIYTPEKERVEYNIPPKEENLIFKDVDLFRLRSERKKWELLQKKTRPFIQSTRT
jgi:tetratricopeptide (TPR) repeat protein